MKNPKADSIVAGFLEYLKKENSISLLPEIVRKLQAMADESGSIARVITSSKLSSSQKARVEKILSSRLGIKHADYEINTDILGGLQVWIGDKVIDLSLQGKLEYIGKSIQKN